MKSVEFRLCKVRLKEGVEDFIINKLGVLSDDKWYPAAHIIGEESEPKLYIVQCENVLMTFNSDTVEEMEHFKLPTYSNNLKEIKLQLANIDLCEWLIGSVINRYQIGTVSASKEIQIKNAIEGSEWREYFSPDQKYIFVREANTRYGVAVQVRKGAIFYIGEQDLELFKVMDSPPEEIFTDEQKYETLKEVKYIISNLIK